VATTQIITASVTADSIFWANL